ncbi:MAG TPA: NFACT RNA binding domain-containing protein, partial [Ktedonobacterales bacterium]|nr:NFACT RNA binding domain-containing protein [Ktedonobacterales bacterium]
SKIIIAPDDVAAWDAIAAVARDLAGRADRGEWEPTAILDDDGHVTDGALWPPCFAANRTQRSMRSVNELLAGYFAAREWGDALAGARSGLRRSLKTSHERLQKKLQTLRSELAELAQGDRLRVEGELLLAFANEIPERATTYTPPDFGDGATPQPIMLDPRFTAVENANTRFARYHKMRRAAEQIPEQIARAEVDLARVEQLQTDLELAESLAEIAHVRDEVAVARVGNLGAEERKPRLDGKGSAKAKGKQKGKDKGGKQQPGGAPLSIKSADGFSIYAGKNSMQNEYVTFGIAAGNDLWLHARGVPGAHVIVKNSGRPIPPETLQEAARLAAWYSQSRGASSVPVDYTEQRYVRHMKNGGPGMVIYTHERTLHAVPRDARMAESR